jgi:hypothetical protein
MENQTFIPRQLCEFVDATEAVELPLEQAMQAVELNETEKDPTGQGEHGSKPLAL